MAPLVIEIVFVISSPGLLTLHHHVCDCFLLWSFFFIVSLTSLEYISPTKALCFAVLSLTPGTVSIFYYVLPNNMS